MFCQKCGNQSIEGATFCQKCGAKLYNAETEARQSDTSSADNETTADEFDVTLAYVGTDKVSVIKKVRELTGLGLKESKELVEKAPVLLKKVKTQAEAKSIKMSFECFGAMVAISSQNNIEDNEYTPFRGNAAVEPLPTFGSIYCPKCQSQKLQTIIESNTEGTGGGYGAGKGCFGYLLLGPLGLLCGACGSKAKITTTNKTHFMCMDCGNKFREADELSAEKSKESVLAIIGGAGGVVLGLLMLTSGELWGLAMMLLGGLFVYSGFICKKESEEIAAKKYESECYKKQTK